MAEGTPPEPTTIVGRLRSRSLSLAESAWKLNPQPGMWAATGTAIAYAPTLTELREPIAGGDNIEFNQHGHSARTITTDEDGEPILSQLSQPPTRILDNQAPENEAGKEILQFQRRPTLAEQASSDSKHTWVQTIANGFKALYKFASTPTGFLMTIYGLNIVAWGAMLFFLLLDAAPAMDHPNKDALSSPRKKWLEVDSQILNALFCVTGFGLAPWRFRDLWWLARARFWRDQYSMLRLEEQNRAWFRPPVWFVEEDMRDNEERINEKRVTFTGEVAPPTRIWKLSFVVWMMVLNTLFQCVLAGFMWGYNRVNRPSWATGTFIALGCGVSLAAGVMMWWEGRKIKKIEGPVIQHVDVMERKSHRLLR